MNADRSAVGQAVQPSPLPDGNTRTSHGTGTNQTALQSEGVAPAAVDDSTTVYSVPSEFLTSMSSGIAEIGQENDAKLLPDVEPGRAALAVFHPNSERGLLLTVDPASATVGDVQEFVFLSSGIPKSDHCLIWQSSMLVRPEAKLCKLGIVAAGKETATGETVSFLGTPTFDKMTDDDLSTASGGVLCVCTFVAHRFSPRTGTCVRLQTSSQWSFCRWTLIHATPTN